MTRLSDQKEGDDIPTLSQIILKGPISGRRRRRMERELSLERYVLSALRGLTQRYNSDRLGVANEEVRTRLRTVCNIRCPSNSISRHSNLSTDREIFHIPNYSSKLRG